jgi:hypothetical protein
VEKIEMKMGSKVEVKIRREGERGEKTRREGERGEKTRREGERGEKTRREEGIEERQGGNNDGN